KMLKPLPFANSRVTLDWYHYNHGKKSQEYNTSGAYEVESVVHSAWQFKNESIGFFFANVTDEAASVQVDIDLSQYDLAQKEDCRIRLYENGAFTELSKIGSDGKGKVELAISGKSVVMVEVV